MSDSNGLTEITGDQSLNVQGDFSVKDGATVSLPDDAIDTDEIADDAVDADKLADDAVDTDAIADDAVDADKLDETDTFTAADYVTDNCASVDTLYTEAKALTNELKADLTDALAALSLTIKDNDNAASTGTALYVDRVVGPCLNLNANCTGGSADSYVAIGSDLATVLDNGGDAEGVALYLEEATQTLYAAIPGGGYIVTANGRCIPVEYAADGTGCIALYFDDDGATASERVLFVSAADPNADSSVACSTVTSALFTRPTITAGDIS